MKLRVKKKRIRRYITWFAKHKIPKAFRNRRDRNEWIDYIAMLRKCTGWDFEQGEWYRVSEVWPMIEH